MYDQIIGMVAIVIDTNEKGKIVDVCEDAENTIFVIQMKEGLIKRRPIDGIKVLRDSFVNKKTLIEKEIENLISKRKFIERFELINAL